jgi:hypothetical protein
VVDGGGVATAVAAPLAVAGEDAGPGPAGPGGVPPLGDDVLDETYDAREREDAQLYVGLRFVHDGDLPAEHADRVAQGHPVEGSEVGVEYEYRVHRNHLPILVAGWVCARVRTCERLAGFEPAVFAMARRRSSSELQPHGADGGSRTREPRPYQGRALT